MILVIGATGTTGAEVVKALTAGGQKIRALARHPEKAAAIQGPNVEFVKGDLADPKSLEAAFKGVDKVFLVSAPDPNVVTLHGNAYAAAKKAGVKHLVRLSALGAALDSPVSLLKWHGEADQALAKSGVPYTILRPHFFMQNTVMFAGTIKAQGAFYAPMGDAKIAPIDVRDIGAVAASVLTSSGHEGKTYDLTGPQAISFHDLAASLTKVVGKPVKYVSVPPADARKAMVGMGLPDWMADGLVGLYGQFAAGKGAAVSKTTEQVTKKPGRTVEGFTKDFASAFRA